MQKGLGAYFGQPGAPHGPVLTGLGTYFGRSGMARGPVLTGLGTCFGDVGVPERLCRKVLANSGILRVCAERSWSLLWSTWSPHGPILTGLGTYFRRSGTARGSVQRGLGTCFGDIGVPERLCRKVLANSGILRVCAERSWSLLWSTWSPHGPILTGLGTYFRRSGTARGSVQRGLGTCFVDFEVPEGLCRKVLEPTLVRLGLLTALY